jgi:hypothetical protein
MNLVSFDLETTLDHETIRVGGLHYEDPTLGACRHFFHDEAGLIAALNCVINTLGTEWHLATWNGSGFDFDVMRNVWGFDIEDWMKSKGICHIDGMILSKMLTPDRHSHSLDSYAKELSWYSPWKPDDISWYDTADMSDLMVYLNTDLKVTAQVVAGLQVTAGTVGGKWGHALKLEQKVRELVNRQRNIGVEFDVAYACQIAAAIDTEMETIEKRCNPMLPNLPVDKPKMPPKKQFKSDGYPSALLLKYLDNNGFDCPVRDTGTTWVAENPTSHKRVHLPLTQALPQYEKVTLSNQKKLKQWLMSQGWTPTWWNTKKVKCDKTGRMSEVQTSPRLNHQMSKDPCPNLNKFGGLGKDISTWLMLRSRRSLLHNDTKTTGLIPRALLNHDILASDADTTGTPTARFRHKGIVNIPSVDAPWGSDFRRMFKARDNAVWVGWDASSLEAAIEAHYTYPFDPDYSKALVEGDSANGTDVHSLNQKMLGLPNRRMAKIFKYAVTYGAQAATVAKQLGVTKSVAQRYLDEFWEKSVGLSELKKELIREWKFYGSKRIVGLDGRLISTRSEHSLINAKFQSGGAILMKHAMLIAHHNIHKLVDGTDVLAEGLIRMHDEEQWEVINGDPSIHTRIGELGVESIEKAAKFLKLNVPVTGEYKIGLNWEETH